MKKLLIALYAIFLLLSCKKELMPATNGTAPALPWADSSGTHPLNDVYSKLVTKYNRLGLPGISLLINDKYGTWIGAAGKADIGQNIDFATTQVSKIASVTKLMIGTVFFKLMEDSSSSGIGYNSLQTKITEWIPSHQLNKIANGNLVTLGQLLKHESGIPELTEEQDFYLAVLNSPNKRWNQDELLSFVKGSGAVFAPGDTAIYSNTNYLLLSMILDKLSDGNHAKLLRDKIFTPLGMNHSYYQPHDDLPENTAQGYYDLYRNHTLINVSNYLTGSGNGFGGVFSNVSDMYLFIDALLIKKSFLTEKSLTMMNKFGKSDGTNRYGFGIMKKFIERGINAGLGHSGRDLGYTANLFYFPEKKVAHAFVINYGTDADSYLKETFRQFQDELLDITLNN